MTCSSVTLPKGGEGGGRGTDGGAGEVVLGGGNVQHIARVGDDNETIPRLERGGQLVIDGHEAIASDDDRLTGLQTPERQRSVHLASVGCIP